MKAIKIKRILEGISNGGDSYSLLYQTLNEQENWFKMIRKDVAYESIINEIKVESERLLNEPIEELSYTLFKLFEETGSRIEFERVYFEKRRRLNTFAIMSLLEPGNRICQEELHQIIWSICNEYSWCLPAHLKDSPELSMVNDCSLVRQPKQYTIDNGFS